MASEWKSIEALGVEIEQAARTRAVTLDEELMWAMAVIVDGTVQTVAESMGIKPSTVRRTYGHLFIATDILDSALKALGRL